MSAHVIEVQSLSRRFGKSLALDQISFDIQPGWVYGLVGANGAGKTTLMKHLLGLLKAKQGTVRVFGLDPVIHPVDVLSRIGYLSEERDLPEWMRIDELLKYTRAYYPNWDSKYAQELLDTFALDPSKRDRTPEPLDGESCNCLIKRLGRLEQLTSLCSLESTSIGLVAAFFLAVDADGRGM